MVMQTLTSEVTTVLDDRQVKKREEVKPSTAS
jgi:hypothetical protein